MKKCFTIIKKIFFQRRYFVIKILLFSLISMNLIGCSSERITVIGVAEDEKNIAAVNSGDRWYLVKGLHHWDSTYLGRNVRVRGVLYIHKYIPDTTGVTRQTNGEDNYYLLKAKWKLVK